VSGPAVTGRAHAATSTVLVAYASAFGATEGVADAVATTLRRRGFTVETRRVQDVDDVSTYSAVVIGGAIQYDTWITEARRFVAAHQEALSGIPVAYFLTCLVLARRSVGASSQAAGYAATLAGLSDRVSPVSIGQFAGALHFSRMPRVMVLAFKVASLVLRVGEGDYRDWKAIDAWADALPFTVESPTVHTRQE
jgi:menaquinone-dependent protoporphyrinogen oxidase